MYAFEYHRPTSVRQAANLLGKLDEAKIVAGGHTLLPTMKQRLAAPKNLIDLAGVADLRGIERSGRSVAIGAMTTHAEVAESAAVREAIPALGRACRDDRRSGGAPSRHHRRLGREQRSRRGLSRRLPGARRDDRTNKRKIAADDYFKGLFETALEDGEIVTKVTFPIPQKAGYMKFRNPASRYALVGVFVAKRAAEIRVAVTGAGAGGVFRWAAAEEALKKRFAAKSLEGLSHPAGRPQRRHPRRRDLPRPPHRRHGKARRPSRDRPVS